MIGDTAKKIPSAHAATGGTSDAVGYMMLAIGVIIPSNVTIAAIINKEIRSSFLAFADISRLDLLYSDKLSPAGGPRLLHTVIAGQGPLRVDFRPSPERESGL
jgi:hypothetical protein